MLCECGSKQNKSNFKNDKRAYAYDNRTIIQEVVRSNFNVKLKMIYILTRINKYARNCKTLIT